MATEPSRASIAALTHIGKVRRRNEDCIAVGDWVSNVPIDTPRLCELALDAPMACVVVDGMGGHAGGDTASQLAAAYLAREVPACTDDAALIACIRAADALLYAEMNRQPALVGMGATIAGLRIAREGLTAFNVGDSRVYRVQDGFLHQLSTDDVPPFNAYSRGGGGRSGMVTQCLGGSAMQAHIQPHIVAESYAPERMYLLCSDGLYDKLAVDAMEAAIDDDLGASVERLFGLAMAKGASDNISIVLVRLSA